MSTDAVGRKERARGEDLLIDEIAADWTRDAEALVRSDWGSERRAEDNMGGGRVRCR